MATEILVNDGGAPARILPFEAYATIAAGDVLQYNSSSKVLPNDVSGARALGVALTAATSGTMANVISGRGVVVRANCTGTLSAGDNLDCAGNGKLKKAKALNGHAVAILLEDASGASTSKVMLL